MLVACGAREASPYSPDPAKLDAAIVEEPAAPRATTLRAPETRASTTRLREASPPPPRRSGKRITLRLAHAPLGEVVRMLASEAGLGVVLASSLDQPVSLDVTRADPLAVLDALASAHRLELEQRGGLLIVRRAGG